LKNVQLLSEEFVRIQPPAFPLRMGVRLLVCGNLGKKSILSVDFIQVFTVHLTLPTTDHAMGRRLIQWSHDITTMWFFGIFFKKKWVLQLFYLMPYGHGLCYATTLLDLYSCKKFQ